MNPISNHPNASVAAVAGALVTMGVWAASVAGVDVPPEVAAGALTVLTAAILAVGRRKSGASES